MALPKQTKYIVGNEACERFSFYGLRCILALYMTGHLLMSKENATEVIHLFLALIYLMPLIGGWLADNFLGRYRTIFWISLFYCLGHGVLATADLTECLKTQEYILYTGLFIIALGSGGIKPCVSAFVGDQMDGQPPVALTRMYALFYWSINLGSFFSFIVIPLIRQNWGYSWAFGIPGIFMALATFVFWLGRKKYLHKAPTQPAFLPSLFTRLTKGKLEASKKFGTETLTKTSKTCKNIIKFLLIAPLVIALGLGVKMGVIELCVACSASATATTLIGMLSVVLYAAFIAGLALRIAAKRKQEGFFGTAGSMLFMGSEHTQRTYSQESCKNTRNLLRVLVVFAMIIPFWSLFDQTASTWVIQGEQMRSIPVDISWIHPSLQLTFNAEMMQSINPLLVMVFVPLLTLLIYPYIGTWSTPLRRMSMGIIVAAASYGVVAWLQHRLDGGESLSIAWQIIPYFLLTISEILVSTTGLEYAYSAAGKNQKSTVISFWNLTITMGNLLVVALAAILSDFSATTSFVLYTLLTLAMGILFAFVTTRKSFQAEV